MWLDWVIYFTLGNFLKPVATNILPKSPTFLGNFGKGGKLFHFYAEIIKLATFKNMWQLFTGHTAYDSIEGFCTFQGDRKGFLI